MNILLQNPLQPQLKRAILFSQSEKEIAEPRNSNNQTLANKSTPSNRAIFVCSTRTPQENNRLKIELVAFLSMVACSGKGSPFAVFQSSQFSSPLHVTAQTLESLAVASKNLTLELSAMLFKFLTGSRLKITIRANSEQEARQRLQLSESAICIARYSNAFLAQKQAKMTACKGVSANAVHPQHPTTEQIHSLPTASGCGYDVCTTTYEGSRSRYTSGIFLPKIHQNHGLTTPVIHSEFAVRATPRNKADCIRTNKGGYSYVAVEPLSHPISDKSLSLTKTYDTMKKPTQTRKGIIAKLTAFPFVLSTEKGACYA